MKQEKLNFLERKLKCEFHNRKHIYVDECFPIEAVNAIIEMFFEETASREKESVQ